MASTTTIRIGDDLKVRIAAAAERAEKSAHAFILEAISRTVEQAELNEAFHDVAGERWAKMLATGKTILWDDAKAWLGARAQGLGPGEFATSSRPYKSSPTARSLGDLSGAASTN